ncbi:tetratricopeptide repeat protein [Chlorogloea sp. CCALA 695]|uniref:tetratricopeptide repeat protein n=1 Tax=Chlorogloea sp. CCALA 695 TaxID=2107693 RepID=UPI000D06364A|nr:tetratricopeptide repeat protein [Chlorogloea sp. CCALA 695]PSB35514.1 Tfp pilus assembly protein PilF [Chlorogloea sp. CCALA 695]
MSKKSNRWLINIILVVATIALVGGSMLPLLTSTIEQSQPPTASPLASGQTPTAQKSQLTDQVRGFELVLQREPENQTALQGLVDAKIKLGDVKGAIPSIEKLAALNPTQTQYTLLLAQAKVRTGDIEGGQNAYRSILKTNPSDNLALQGLVLTLLQQQRPDEAISFLQDTLTKAKAGSADTTTVQLLLGEVYANQKRYDEAIATYDRAIATNAKDVRPFLAKGSVLAVQKRYDDAISLYDRATGIDSKDFRPVLAKASVLKEQGKNDQAKPLFETAANLAPPEYKAQIQQLAIASPTPSIAPSPIAPSTPSPSPTTTP